MNPTIPDDPSMGSPLDSLHIPTAWTRDDIMLFLCRVRDSILYLGSIISANSLKMLIITELTDWDMLREPGYYRAARSSGVATWPAGKNGPGLAAGNGILQVVLLGDMIIHKYLGNSGGEYYRVGSLFTQDYSDWQISVPIQPVGFSAAPISVNVGSAGSYILPHTLGTSNWVGVAYNANGTIPEGVRVNYNILGDNSVDPDNFVLTSDYPDGFVGYVQFVV